jgi:hypothetical protein
MTSGLGRVPPLSPTIGPSVIVVRMFVHEQTRGQSGSCPDPRGIDVIRPSSAPLRTCVDDPPSIASMSSPAFTPRASASATSIATTGPVVDRSK